MVHLGFHWLAVTFDRIMWKLELTAFPYLYFFRVTAFMHIMPYFQSIIMQYFLQKCLLGNLLHLIWENIPADPKHALLLWAHSLALIDPILHQPRMYKRDSRHFVKKSPHARNTKLQEAVSWQKMQKAQCSCPQLDLTLSYI